MADSDFLFQDWSDEDVPCDPGPDWSRATVGTIVSMLMAACRNEDVAWNLDHALLSIAHRKIGPYVFQLREDDRDEILSLLTHAKVLLPNFIPGYPDQRLAVGLDAAAVQVILWAETDEQQALRHPDTKADAHDLGSGPISLAWRACL